MSGNVALPTANHLRRWLAIGGLALLAGLLLLDLSKVALTIANALRYPFEIDYGEGIVWQQLDSIVAGRGYAPLQTFPAIVFHYPPVYYIVTAAVIKLAGVDPLYAGRLVSAASALGCGMIVARLAWLAMPKDIGARAAAFAAVLAGLSFIASPTVLLWSPLMRVDMVASLLTLACLWQTLAAVERPSRVPVAALLGALAVYTKQTAIIAPACAFMLLLCVRPRLAWAFAIWCGGTAVAVLAALIVATNGEFLNHALLYNVNRFDPERWLLIAGVVLTQPITVVLAVAAAASAWQHLRNASWAEFRTRLQSDTAARALALALIYLIARTAAFPMILKSGANSNYLIDWLSAATIFVGLAIAAVSSAIQRDERWPRALVTVLVLVGLPVQAYRLEVTYTGAHNADARTRLWGTAALIAASPRPVISDDMVLLRRAGRPVLFEPAITAELAHAGRYDQAGFITMIRRRAFGFFITNGRRGDRMFDERYSPAVADAMDAAYPQLVQQGDLTLHLPR